MWRNFSEIELSPKHVKFSFKKYFHGIEKILKFFIISKSTKMINLDIKSPQKNSQKIFLLKFRNFSTNSPRSKSTQMM